MSKPDEIDEDRIISELNVNSGLDNIFKIFYNDAWNEGYSIGLGNKEPEIRSDYELKKCREIKQQLLALKSKWGAEAYKKGYIDGGINQLTNGDKR